MQALEPGQTPNDRPDICARVFNQKLDAIKEDITKKGVLGKHLAHVHVVEFQKRGLPHAHILLILANGHQPTTVEEINRVVSAEIPDPQLQPNLYHAVTTHMLHGPCHPDKCLKNGTCTKNYPKSSQKKHQL